MTTAFISDERLERALVAAALVVEMHGDVYAPIFERLEKEVASRRNSDNPRARARRLLETRLMDATVIGRGITSNASERGGASGTLQRR